MNIVLWVIAGLLAAVFLGAGLMKLAQPRKRLADSGMGWVEDFGDGSVKGIGGLEVLGALGLVLPAAVDVVVPAVRLSAVLWPYHPLLGPDDSRAGA